ncbi:MAG: hypothetical protein ACREH8_08460 [Opitutaceae bacterium]
MTNTHPTGASAGLAFSPVSFVALLVGPIAFLSSSAISGVGNTTGVMLVEVYEAP